MMMMMMRMVRMMMMLMTKTVMVVKVVAMTMCDLGTVFVHFSQHGRNRGSGTPLVGITDHT